MESLLVLFEPGIVSKTAWTQNHVSLMRKHHRQIIENDRHSNYLRLKIVHGKRQRDKDTLKQRRLIHKAPKKKKQTIPRTQKLKCDFQLLATFGESQENKN